VFFFLEVILHLLKRKFINEINGFRINQHYMRNEVHIRVQPGTSGIATVRAS